MQRMLPVVAVGVAVLFAAQLALGMGATRSEALAQPLLSWHMFGGMALAGAVALIQLTAMIRALQSAREIREAASALGEGSPVIRRLWAVRTGTLALAILAIAVTGAAVMLGGKVHHGEVESWIHWATGLSGLAVNLAAFGAAYAVLKAEGRLLREAGARPAPGIAPNRPRDP